MTMLGEACAVRDLVWHKEPAAGGGAWDSPNYFHPRQPFGRATVCDQKTQQLWFTIVEKISPSWSLQKKGLGAKTISRWFYQNQHKLVFLMGIHENQKCFLLFWPPSSFPPFPCVSQTTLQDKETEARITRGGRTIALTMAAYVLLSTQAPSYFHLSEFIGTPDLCKFAFSERSSWLHGTLGMLGIFNL